MVGCAATGLHCGEASAGSSYLWLPSTGNRLGLRSNFLDTSDGSTTGITATEDATFTGTSSPSRSRFLEKRIKLRPECAVHKSKAIGRGWTSFASFLTPAQQQAHTAQMSHNLYQIDQHIAHTKWVIEDMTRRKKTNDGVYTKEQYQEKLEHLKIQRRAIEDGLKPPREEESGEMQYEKVISMGMPPQKVPGSLNTWGALAHESSLRADEYERLAREASDNAGYYDYVARVAASHAQAAQLQVEISARASMEHSPTIRKILEHCRLTKSIVEEDPSKAKEPAYLATREFCAGVDSALDDATRVPQRTELPDLGYATYEQPTRDFPIPPPPASDSQAAASGPRVEEQGLAEHTKQDEVDFEGALDKCVIS